ISEIVEHTLGEPLKFYSAEEWLRQWLDGKRKAKAAGTYLKYRRTIESFIESLGPKAKKNLNQITPREIQRFRDGELEAGKHSSTCDSLLKHLRMPFRVAVRQGYVTSISENAAVGAIALSNNSWGFNNTAVGTQALVQNTRGD